MIDTTSDTPFNHSLKTLERMHDLMVQAREARINLSWHTYKLSLFELYKEIAPFLCDNINHYTTDGGCNKKGCDLSRVEVLWKQIENKTIKLDHYKRVTEIDTDVIPLLDKFDFVLKQIMKNKGLSYIKGSDKGLAILGKE